MLTTYMDGQCLKNLPVNGFKWVNSLPKFNGIFIRNYNENSDKGYFLELDADYPKKVFSLHKDLPYLQHTRQRKVCYAYKSLKTSLKSWISI